MLGLDLNLIMFALIWWDIHGATGILPCPHWWMPEAVSKSSVDDVRKANISPGLVKVVPAVQCSLACRNKFEQTT